MTKLCKQNLTLCRLFRITFTNGWGTTEFITSLLTPTRIHITQRGDSSFRTWDGCWFANIRTLSKRVLPLTWATWRKIGLLSGNEGMFSSKNLQSILNTNFEQICNFIFFRLYIILMPVLCFLIPTWVPCYFWGERAMYSWYITIFRYTTALNLTWLVNSAAHIWGTKPYDK